jgi:hypothetical protein
LDQAPRLPWTTLHHGAARPERLRRHAAHPEFDAVLARSTVWLRGTSSKRGRGTKSGHGVSAGRLTWDIGTRWDNGALVGDQDGVEGLGEGRGIIRRPLLPPIRCRQMLFEQIAYHPAEAPERPAPLWQMRLLNADGPRIAFDGTELRHPREVLAALDRAAQANDPRERPIETEIRPLIPFVKELTGDEPTSG